MGINAFYGLERHNAFTWWGRACPERLSRANESNGHLCLLRAGKTQCVHVVEQAFRPSSAAKTRCAYVVEQALMPSSAAKTRCAYGVEQAFRPAVKAMPNCRLQPLR